MEGKILGDYIAKHFKGEKVGYLYQDDEFGQDFVKGLDMELPSSTVVSRQTYDAATLSGLLSTQMSALQAAGVQVVAMATIPAATALGMLAAYVIHYSPQYVVSSVGADSPTVGPLLQSFAKTNTVSALLSGMIWNDYLPPLNDTSNAWIKVEKKLLQDYAPSLWSKYGLDGNTSYGVALGYTFVQALEAAGKNLTRQGLINAIASSGKSFATPGLVPLSYSSSVHFGYEGSEVVQYETSAPMVTTPTGAWLGTVVKSPVEVTSPGSGPVTTYTGKVSSPPSDLVNTA